MLKLVILHHELIVSRPSEAETIAETKSTDTHNSEQLSIKDFTEYICYKMKVSSLFSLCTEKKVIAGTKLGNTLNCYFL
jgi:hypothetical protein